MGFSHHHYSGNDCVLAVLIEEVDEGPFSCCRDAWQVEYKCHAGFWRSSGTQGAEKNNMRGPKHAYGTLEPLKLFRHVYPVLCNYKNKITWP
jgi:hypothetical protein